MILSFDQKPEKPGKPMMASYTIAKVRKVTGNALLSTP